MITTDSENGAQWFVSFNVLKCAFGFGRGSRMAYATVLRTVGSETHVGSTPTLGTTGEDEND